MISGWLFVHVKMHKTLHDITFDITNRYREYFIALFIKKSSKTNDLIYFTYFDL